MKLRPTTQCFITLPILAAPGDSSVETLTHSPEATAICHLSLCNAPVRGYRRNCQLEEFRARDAAAAMTALLYLQNFALILFFNRGIGRVLDDAGREHRLPGDAGSYEFCLNVGEQGAIRLVAQPRLDLLNL